MISANGWSLLELVVKELINRIVANDVSLGLRDMKFLVLGFGKKS